MSCGDADQPGDGDRAGDSRHDLDRDTGRQAGLDLLAAAAEHERVATLEPDDGPPRLGVFDEQRVDRLLRREPAARDLPHVDDLDVRAQPLERGQRSQPVDHDDISLGEALDAAERDQPRVTGAPSNQDHPTRRERAGSAARCLSRTESIGHGSNCHVAQGRRLPRVSIGMHRNGCRSGAPGRRHPGARRARVVGPQAPDPRGIGLGEHCGVHLGVSRAGHRKPRAAQVTLGVPALLPVQPATCGQVGQGGLHLGRDQHDLGPGVQQGRHAAQADRATADDDRSAAGNPQADREQRAVAAHWDAGRAGRGEGTAMRLR
jgi:hypothetical protein